MSDVVYFNKIKPADRLKKKARAHTMCKRGFHKWQIVTEQKFDVKQGQLVTVSLCKHCGKKRPKRFNRATK